MWYFTAIKFFESGYDVTASIPRWKEIPDYIDKLSKKGITTKFNTVGKDYKKIINRLLPSSLQLDQKDDGFKYLLGVNPDLVIINQGGNSGGIDLMEFCIKNDLKFVTISHAANEAKWPTDELNKRLSKALPKAIMNYYVCKSNIELTQIQIGQKILNSKVVFNPFNVSYNSEVEYPQSGDKFYIANAARFEFYAKGQDILFQVMNEKKWRDRNLIVNLYGKGEHVYSVQKLKDYFSLDNVKINSHIPPSEIWKQNQALILTSRYEGLPLVIVESMLCGRTVIATSVSGNPEVITDNENGFLAKAAKAEFVDEALERAWQRRSEWEEMGMKAKLHIKSIIPENPVDCFLKELTGLKI